jgi:hypothetical protein
MLEATVKFFDDFLGNQFITATATAPGVWAKCDTSSAGAPTLQGVASENGGAVQGLLASTSEAEYLTLYWGDILGILATKLRRFSCRIKSTAITTAEALVFGMCSARNDTLDSVAHNAWFKLAATSDILVETDDAVTDDDDNDTLLNITAATYKEYAIDFRQGLADVRFFVSDDNGRMARVLKTTTFSMAGSAAIYFQPIIEIQKASGTTVPSFTVDWVEIEYVR